MSYKTVFCSLLVESCVKEAKPIYKITKSKIQNMRKQLISAMLMLGAAGGLSGFPLPIQATVALSPAVQVKGQVVDENGQPLIGATVKEKEGNPEQSLIWMAILC